MIPRSPPVAGAAAITLAPGCLGTSTTFSGSYALTQADIDAGKVDQHSLLPIPIRPSPSPMKDNR